MFSLASLVNPVQNKFFPHFYISPSPINLGRQLGWFTCVSVCVPDFNASDIFLKGTMGMKKTMEKRETPHLSFRVFLTHALSLVVFHYCQEIDFC